MATLITGLTTLGIGPTSGANIEHFILLGLNAGAAATPSTYMNLGVLHGLPVQYADLNTPLRGLPVEYGTVGDQHYVGLPPQHRGL